MEFQARTNIGGEYVNNITNGSYRLDRSIVGNLRRIRTPHGLAVDWAGNVYVADTVNRRAREFPRSDRLSTDLQTGDSHGLAS